MKQIISVCVGQGGIQLGNCCWQLFCLQHNINASGQKPLQTNEQKSNPLQILFQQHNLNKCIPRTLMIDLDSQIVDQVRMGIHRQLYHADNLVGGKENAASNYARGKYTLGKAMVDIVLQKIRKLADHCENLQGFMIFQSLGGGTGSGFGSLILQKLSQEYPKKNKMDFAIFPSPQLSTSSVEPYNVILGAHKLRQHMDSCVVLQNSAVYSICQKVLDIDCPNYLNINHLSAQLINTLLSGSHQNDPQDSLLSDFSNSLVPYPSIQFLLSSYSPIFSVDKTYCSFVQCQDITYSCFQSHCMMAKCDPRYGKYIASKLIYRGDLQKKYVNETLGKLKTKKTINFVDWVQTKFQPKIYNRPMIVKKQGDLMRTSLSCAMISNTTSISQVFKRIAYKFDLMYCKRAFVHSFIGESIQQNQFTQARQDIAALQNDYQQIQNTDQIDQ